MQKTELNISGLSCMHCVTKVKNTLQEVEGIESVDVSRETGKVIIEADQIPPIDQLNALLEEVGDYRLS
jgi:copper chaperone CopZ